MKALEFIQIAYKLTNFRKLESNWDSYEAAPMNEDSMTLFTQFLIKLEYECWKQGIDLPAPDVFPNPAGHVAMELGKFDKTGFELELDVFIDENGQKIIEWLWCPEKNDTTWVENREVLDLKNLGNYWVIETLINNLKDNALE